MANSGNSGKFLQRQSLRGPQTQTLDQEKDLSASSGLRAEENLQISRFWNNQK